MFAVKIVTPERSQDPLEAVHVTLPTVDGEWGIRTGHMPFVCLLVAGRLLVRCAGTGEEHRFRIGQGVAHVHQDQVEIYVETAVEEG